MSLLLLVVLTLAALGTLQPAAPALQAQATASQKLDAALVTKINDSLAGTPILRLDPNVDHAPDYFADWQKAPFDPPFTNGYRMGWEAFIRHVVAGEPLRADIGAGLRDVALAKAAEASIAEERWVPISRFV